VHTSRNAHLSLLDKTVVTLDEVEKWSSSLRNFHPPVTSHSAQRPPIYQQHLTIQLVSKRFIIRNRQSVPFFPHGATVLGGAGPPHYPDFTITLRHITLGRTLLDEWSARRRDLYLTTHSTYKKQTSTPPIRTHNLTKQIRLHISCILLLTETPKTNTEIIF